MSKEIRFSELVKKSGHPKTATLWTKPERNKDFMTAVKQNRVLTIVQSTDHAHKDFGEIGFHEQPLAMYLVFPKTLPREPDTHVIGLKYDLIEEPAVSHPVRDVKPPKRVQKPVEKDFEVVVERTAIMQLTLRVSAKNQNEARAQALESVKEQNFDLTRAKIENKTRSVKEV